VANAPPTSASVDGGRTWRIDGPVFHVPPAQGPVAVSQAGAASSVTYFAWEDLGMNNVIDITIDEVEAYLRSDDR